MPLRARCEKTPDFILRRSCKEKNFVEIGLTHQFRLLRWQARAALDRLDDAKPGPAEALHALLGWERDAIVALAEDWGEVDRSHRKLAHRGSRLDRVYVSESTVLRVLDAAGMRLPGPAAREKRPARPWPDWASRLATWSSTGPSTYATSASDRETASRW